MNENLPFKRKSIFDVVPTKIKWIVYPALLFMLISQIKYRFSHPEMSETQLFLHFFDAYMEFFR